MERVELLGLGFRSKPLVVLQERSGVPFAQERRRLCGVTAIREVVDGRGVPETILDQLEIEGISECTKFSLEGAVAGSRGEQ